MAKNFWEKDDLIQPAKAEPLPWEADSIVKSSKAINLEAETKKYEEEVPFLQRITDPIKAGIAKIPGYLPGIEVSSIQKQINAIREGKGGPRDPVTGESLPFQPEEAEAAIKMLQAQQAEAQKKYMAAQAESGKYRTRPSVAAVGDAKTAREAFDLFQVDPLGVMASVSLESVPQIVPALVLGAVTRNPTVGALAMGSTSFGGELSSGVMENFQDKGINIKDPVAVNKALNDPVLFAEAYNHALTRASIIGPLDAASAGLASKMLVPQQVIKNQFAKEAVNIGVAQPVAQMISGGGGEALAQLATEGEITKPGQVITEMVGEGPSSVLETAAFGGKQAYDRLKASQPPAQTAQPAQPAAPVTPVTPAAAAPTVTPSGVLTPSDFEEDAAAQPAAPVTPVTPPPAPPAEPEAAAPVTPPPVLPEEITNRIAQLQAEFQQIDQAYATATPDQFAQLNARQGQIKNEIAALQSGAPVTPVTPTPIEKVKPKKEPSVQKGFVRVYHSGSKGEGETGRFVSTNRQYAADYRGDLPLYYTDIPANDPRVNNPDYAEQGVGQGFTFNFELTPEEATTLKEIPREAVAPVTEPLEKYIKTRQAGQNTIQTLDLNKEEGEKLLKDNGFTFEDGYYVKDNEYVRFDKNFQGGTYFYEKFDQKKQSPKIEELKSLLDNKDKDGTYQFFKDNKMNYLALSGSQSLNPIQRSRLMPYIEEGQKLDNLNKKPEPAVSTKSQAEINKERQAEKKAAAEKAKQPVDTSGVKDLIEGKIKKVLGWTVYKRKVDPDFWYVQSPDNHAENKIGPGDDVSTNLDTARARIEQYIADAEYDARKAAEKPAEKKSKTEKVTEAKPKIEDIVSPEVASAMKDIEFQKKLIKANNEKSITEAQFNKVFNLQQSGKTAEADAQLTKILEKKEKKNKEEHIEGNKSEPITSKTIEDAIDKADDKVDAKKIKQSIKNQFDQAIKRASIPTEKEWANSKKYTGATPYVTISIPGDGQFKVKNNVERLKELQTKMVNATTLKGPTVKGAPTSGSVEAFKGMVDDKDMENAIEYAKLKGLDPKTVKLTPAQRTTVDNYLKNPAEFERQKEEADQMAEARQTALRADQEKRIAERLEADEKRQEEARFKAVLDTTIRSTESQLKGDIAKRKITSMDAARMLEVIPGLPTGTVKPYVIKELEKVAGVKPTEEKDNIKGFTANLPTIRQTKVKNDLLADINYKGEITSRADLIQRLVNEGRTITEIKNKKPITKTQEQEKNQLSKKYIVGASNENLPGVKRLKELQDIAKNGNVTVERVLGTEELHLAQDQITKTGMDYAQYLIDKKSLPDESRTIDVEAVDITPAQVKLLTNQVNKLSDADIATLEEHYGVANYSSDFMKRIREDVVKYVNKGADAVDAAIRNIIAKLQAGLLSVAVVFNPATFQTPDFDIPRFVEETKTITAVVPQRAEMSAVADKAYSITAPAFIKANKAFFIADKPNGKIHLFDTDGKFLKSSDALYGKQAGDVLTAEARVMPIEKMQDIDKITPAGVFNLSVSKAPDYTGGYTLRFTDDKGDMGGVAIHAVYTGDVKENREAKLASKDPNDKKISFGCINVDTSFFTGNIIPRIDKMENAGVVVIPDAQEQLDLFVKPTTEKVAAPAKEIKTAERKKIVGRETPYYNDFTSNLDESYFDKQIVKTREEKVTDYAQARAATRRLTKKVAKYGSDIPLQRELNTLLEIEQDLKNYLDRTKPVRNTAQDFMARATNELAEENIAPEVEAFIRNVFEKNPSILEGLRLSVRTQKAGGRASGNFNPYTRLVTLWKDGSGVEDAKTIRHELTHTLEKMMTPDTKKVLVDQWARAFEKAMKDNVDERSQDFFKAVMDFLENPSKESFDKATKIMPSYDYYQYMNPSEYWAVNAEAMLGAKLGGAWSRFTNAVKKLLEGLKSFFGMDNKFEIHKAMDKILSGDMKRINNETLADYLLQGKYKIDFLENIQEEIDLLNKYGVPKTRRADQTLKDRLIDNYREFREFGKVLSESPIQTRDKFVTGVERNLTLARIKNIFFGQGLEVADVKNFKGQLTDNQKMATGSVALINAIHAGHLFTEVAALGKMEFNSATGMFQAVKSDKSLANVVKLKNKLVKQNGAQHATDIINSYLTAGRARDIQNEYLTRDAELQEALDSGENAEMAQRDYDSVRIAYDKIPNYLLVLDKNNNPITQEIKNDEGKVVDEIRVINDEAIDEFLALDKKHPELKEILENFRAVNHSLIDNAVVASYFSKRKAEKLKASKGYVPWMRTVEEVEDPFQSPSMRVGSLTNVPKERRFKKGFVERDIDDIVHNMLVHSMTLTKNIIRTYAANRIASSYATRNEKGKIKKFKDEGVMSDGSIRTNIIAGGRREIVEFKDPLVAESVLGMETIDLPMINVLGSFAQGLRRGVTSNPLFQLVQVFKDAPTAAAVSGIQNPFKLYFGVMTSFFAALNPNDPIVKIFKSYGIGGYKGSFRTPEKELALQLNLERRNLFNGFLKVLDHIGDASDYAQRRAIYNRVMKETNGDQLQAIIKANNVIDFLKHGSGKLALASIRTTTFMNAYAQSMNVLGTAIAGGGLSGMERKNARKLFRRATYLFVASTVIYCMLKGGDDDYEKLDDQTKLRHYVIGDYKIPMLTSYSFFFKSAVELAYHKITRMGTKNEMDTNRLLTALRDIAADALLGPNITPTGVRPPLEIILKKNFFTGGPITPKGLENLEVFQQWTAATSELGKVISKMSLGALSPIEADHLMKGWFGTAGSLAMAGSDLFTSDKPEKTASQNPLFGPYVLPPEPRLKESLFYPFRDKVEEKHDTFIKMQKRQIKGDAKKYFEENKELIKAHGYVSDAGNSLKQINSEIARVGELPGSKMSAEEKRRRITELQGKKNQLLNGVFEMRKRAGL